MSHPESSEFGEEMEKQAEIQLRQQVIEALKKKDQERFSKRKETPPQSLEEQDQDAIEATALDSLKTDLAGITKTSSVSFAKETMPDPTGKTKDVPTQETKWKTRVIGKAVMPIPEMVWTTKKEPIQVNTGRLREIGREQNKIEGKTIDEARKEINEKLTAAREALKAAEASKAVVPRGQVTNVKVLERKLELLKELSGK